MGGSPRTPGFRGSRQLPSTAAEPSWHRNQRARRSRARTRLRLLPTDQSRQAADDRALLNHHHGSMAPRGNPQWQAEAHRILTALFTHPTNGPVKGFGGGQGRAAPRPESQGGGCHYCGKGGHYKRECRHWIKGELCSHCGGRHMKATCRRLKEEGSEGGGAKEKGKGAQEVEKGKGKEKE